MTKQPREPLTGRCVCGTVQYAAVARADRAYACHCSECQTRSGSAFAMLLPVPVAGFEVTGETLIVQQEEANGVVATLHLCAQCLTRIYTENPLWSDLRILRAGTLDDSAAAAPAFHIWVSSKQRWFTLPPGVPQYETQPTDPAEWRRLFT